MSESRGEIISVRRGDFIGIRKQVEHEGVNVWPELRDPKRHLVDHEAAYEMHIAAEAIQLSDGDTASVLNGMCGTNAQSYANSPAGTYTVTPTVGNLSALNYYFASFLPGTLTIDESQVKPVKHPLAINRTPAATQAQSKVATLAAHKGK